MMSQLCRGFCVALLLFACVACAHHKKTVPPIHRVVGTVVLVNDTGKFVLIDGGAFFPTHEGIALKTFSGGKETGVLTLSPQRKPPFAIADIVTGNPQKGDQVME